MKLIIVLIFTIIPSLVSAQIYKTNYETGKDPFMYYFRGNAQHVYQAPKDNQLSEWKTLPFRWFFFGEEVTGFFISDNGYITFDSKATKSDPKNVGFPDYNAPKNAIFAYWTDLYLEAGNSQWTNEVCTGTVGEAPNRVFVIYWMGVVPAGLTFSGGNISFCIALYEGGDFDIIHTVSRCSQPLKATVGANNKDGYSSIQIKGSPDYPFPSVGFGDLDDVCIQFRSTVESVNNTCFSNQSELLIYPNPADDKLYFISNMNEENYIASFYDLTGAEILSLKPEALLNEGSRNSFKIETNALCEGLYLIKLKSSKNIDSKLVMIAR